MPDVHSLSDAPAAQALHRPWGIALLGYAVLGLGLAIAAALEPPVRLAIEDTWGHVTAFAVHLNATLVPVAVQPLVVKAAKVFLTPWLYLLMLFVYLAEKTVPVNPRQRYASVGFVYDLVAWFVCNSLLRVVIIGAFVSALYTVYERHLAFLTIVSADQWPASLRIVAAFVVGDFLNWFHHLVRHKVPAFWAFHTVHHSQRELNMFTDMRVHVFEHFVAKPLAIIPMLMFGLDGAQLFWMIILTDAYTRLTHANVRTNLGPLRYLLVTPQSHRIHHSAAPEHADKNFGLVLSVWDHLFGTQWRNYDEYAGTGIHDQGFPLESALGPVSMLIAFVRQQIYPFQCVWNALRGRGWELGGLGVTQAAQPDSA